MIEFRKTMGLQPVCAVAIACACVSSAEAGTVFPTTSFTARVIGGMNLLVGNRGDREGMAWRSNGLLIWSSLNQAIVEYDLRGRQRADSVTLDFPIFNFDAPDFSGIELHTFAGNGLANAADFFRTDTLVTTFTDNGLASEPRLEDLFRFSLDVTDAYNNAIVAGDDYLGFHFRTTNSVPGASFARYSIPTSDIGRGPVLTVIPEPASMALLLVGVMVSSLSNRPQGMRKSKQTDCPYGG